MCCQGIKNCHADTASAKCTILISMKIKPYLQAAEGIKEAFDKIENIDTEIFFLEDVEKSWKNDKTLFAMDHPNRSIIAVGPEAVTFLSSNFFDKSIVKVFTMVSNSFPLISKKASSLCGLFLEVNAENQISWIAKVLPQVKSLGILYDKEYNMEYIFQAEKTGKNAGIKIKPLMVSSKDEVPEILRKNWRQLDGLLLIPDATVISASLVKDIIKDGISHNVPVIGYNRFFSQSGALMSFMYDYHKIGTETAILVKKLLFDNRECSSRAADFKIIINRNISKYLGVDVPDSLDGIVMEENE